MKNRSHQKRRRVTATGFAPVANPTQARELHALAASGAAGSHDSRPRRTRTRQAAKRAAIHAEW